MPTTRRQSKAGEIVEPPPKRVKGRGKRKSDAKTTEKHQAEVDVGQKRDADQAKEDLEEHRDEPLTKKVKTREEGQQEATDVYRSGVIERGHIYFFYRPRVEMEEAHSIDEVRNFHMLLIPRPPGFAVAAEEAERSTGIKDKQDPEKVEKAEMEVLEPGADAVPAPTSDKPKQKYRLITIGKKRLPDPEHKGGGRGRELFWATVTAIGDDLKQLREDLGEKTYETKTRGTRHQESARLAARGAYAFVNTVPSTPSKKETHLGYHLSHPPPSEMGEVQKELGILTASSFVVQIKNPLAPATGFPAVRGKGAEYPDWLMKSVFGAYAEEDGQQTKGRESFGLRFASCETPDLLDYLHTQLLLIAARAGEEGLEKSLGEGRGIALKEVEERESHESIEKVFKELGADAERYPPDPLEGGWI